MLVTKGAPDVLIERRAASPRRSTDSSIAVRRLRGHRHDLAAHPDVRAPLDQDVGRTLGHQHELRRTRIHGRLVVVMHGRHPTSLGAERDLCDPAEPAVARGRCSDLLFGDEERRFGRITVDRPAPGRLLVQRRVVGEAAGGRTGATSSSTCRSVTRLDRRPRRARPAGMPTPVISTAPVGGDDLDDRHLVAGQGAGLVGADHRRRPERLDRRQPLDDRPLAPPSAEPRARARPTGSPGSPSGTAATASETPTSSASTVGVERADVGGDARPRRRSMPRARPRRSRARRPSQAICCWSGVGPSSLIEHRGDPTDLGCPCPVATTTPSPRPRTTAVPLNAMLVRSASGASGSIIVGRLATGVLSPVSDASATCSDDDVGQPAVGADGVAFGERDEVADDELGRSGPTRLAVAQHASPAWRSDGGGRRRPRSPSPPARTRCRR